MKDYLIGCGYQADSRIHRALLQILEDNGVEDIMDMVDFAKGSFLGSACMDPSIGAWTW